MNKREIKFRMWDNRTKQWVNNFQVSHDGLIRWLKPSADGTNLEWQSVQGHDVELMQYTGLKDKNGIEIYEGDIVRYNPPVDGSSQVAEVPKLSNFHWYGELDGDEDFQILGNIYANPELLTP